MGSSWELILVNDCSKDGSWKIARKLAKKDKRVTAVSLSNNFGQHNATMCGFSFAKGDYLITMDDDLQHPPEEIEKLIKKIIESDYWVIYGQFSSERKYGWFRNIASNAVNSVLSRITGSGYKVTQFRILKRAVVEKIAEFTQYNVMIDVLIKDLVSVRDVGHCQVEHHERTIGKSNYSVKKLFAYATNMIFSYTLWPLRTATVLGLFFSVVSFLLGLYFLVDYFIHRVPVQGFTSTIVSLAFFSGIILFVLGIVGEYVGRIFLNINRKPQYFVKEVFKQND